ncbi:MAG: secondary thiamine-phosphate synthase enzyme YjbQ [Candidatus Methanomethylicia archaeon]
MNVYFRELSFSTRKRRELIDITNQVEKIVDESSIRNGICLVYAPHATIAIVVNEREAGLMSDIMTKIERDFSSGIEWLHDKIDDNADAHLASAFIGSSRIFPVINGKLIRGTWQNIFVLELDGPRSIRKIIVEIIGE